MGGDHQWWKHQKPFHGQRTGVGQPERLEEALEDLQPGKYLKSSFFRLNRAFVEYFNRTFLCKKLLLKENFWSGEHSSQRGEDPGGRWEGRRSRRRLAAACSLARWCQWKQPSVIFLVTDLICI